MRKSIAAAAISVSALTGGAIGLAVFGPSSVGAQTGAATTTTVPSNAAPQPPRGDGPGGHWQHGFGGDMDRGMGGAAVAAKAIGISETDLTTALRSGKTLAQVAKSHGVAAAKVVDAMVADAKTKVAADVKAGRLTQAEADKLQADLQTRITDMVNGKFPRGGKGDHGFGGPGGGGWREGVGDASVVAKAIGISESDLTTALRSGKTIAAVAKSHGVAASKVVSALVTDGKAELAADVKAGRLTQTEADQMQPRLQQRATDQVNGTFTRGPAGDGPKGPGLGGPGMPPGMVMPHA